MKIFGIAVFMSLTALCSCSRGTYAYLDSGLPIESRVEDLVSRLTLEEKVAQMASAAPAIERLGIPAYDWQNECLHGVGKVADRKVTVFPQPIGLAATWDEEGVRKVADCIADEGRAIYTDAVSRGNHSSYYGLTYWAPNINIFRDPRWGRGHETFGEDPYLTGALGKAFVVGLQGEDPDYLKASACAKHYAVHSGPESLRHEFDVTVSDRDLWETYLPAFRDVVVDGGVSGIMCAYNAYSGRPCCGNDLLMMDILRNKWAFDGYVTSDCGAIDDFYKGHKTHPDTISAASDAVLHGTDLDCIRDVAFKTLVRAVKEGRLSEADIDNAVKRLFTIRFRLGMFDTDIDRGNASDGLAVLDCNAHKALALKMARESIVLLKNDNNVLPLDKNISKIAVVGPNAADDFGMLGNYHGYPSHISTILEAIRGHVSSSTEVYYEKMTNHLWLDDFTPLDFHGNCSIDGKQGYKTEYFNNSGFSGEPVVAYQEGVGLKYLGATEIAEGLNSQNFSVRYTTYFVPDSSAEYTLNLDTDKRFRYSVNDSVCIDAMAGKAKADGRYTAWFEAGKSYKINIEAVMKGRHGYLSFDIGKTVKPSFAQLAGRVKDADVIVFVGGISPALEGEENGVQCPGFEDGDRTTIALPEVQTKLMKELVNTGKPVVFVMMTGSAIASVWEDENVPAIVNAWYGGQAGGEAVADVLFGDYNPGGRLPVTFYRSDNDLPSFTDYNMDGRTYRYFRGKPLYPFGYGLSYTTFACSGLRMPDLVDTAETAEISVTVSNTGSREGDEVVQLYISRINDDRRSPVRSLKGFRRVHLAPGESTEVSFKLTPRDMSAFADSEGIVVRPGVLRIYVGGGQPGTGASVLSRDLNVVGEVNRLSY